MDDLHLRDYSPWEGWEVEGWPTTVMLRGKIMVDQGKLLGQPTDGQLNPSQNRPGGAAASGVLGEGYFPRWRFRGGIVPSPNLPLVTVSKRPMSFPKERSD